MPKAPDPSRVKRFLMQTIKWIILGATVGLAALVDFRQQKFLNADLGEPRQFDSFSVRLPNSWAEDDERINPNALIEVREPYFDAGGRTISVVLKQPSIGDAFAALTGSNDSGATVTRTEKTPVGDLNGTLMVRRTSEGHPLVGFYTVTDVVVSATLPNGKILIIELNRQGGKSKGKELDRDIALMKRIASSVKVDAQP